MGGGSSNSIVKAPGDLPGESHQGILFQTSILAKGILFGNFSQFQSGQGYPFWQVWSKKCEILVIPVKKPKFLYFGPKNVKI